jgi:hypothetical protein
MAAIIASRARAAPPRAKPRCGRRSARVSRAGGRCAVRPARRRFARRPARASRFLKLVGERMALEAIPVRSFLILFSTRTLMTCINSISANTIHPQTNQTNGATSNRDAKIEQLLEEIEQLLMGDDSGGGDDVGDVSPGGNGGNGGNNNSVNGNGNGNSSGGNSVNGPNGGAPGQGLHDIKLNTKAGGEALHLKEDSQGNLYNGSGNSVGVIDKDGNVSLNSGATKELERLETGGNPFMNADVGTRGAGGNMQFSANEVTVSAGDLNQKADF